MSRRSTSQLHTVAKCEGSAFDCNGLWKSCNASSGELCNVQTGCFDCGKKKGGGGSVFTLKV